MKKGKLIATIIVIAAAVVGAVFVVATYGEHIVAWCKKLLGGCKCKKECECKVVDEAPAEETAAEAPAEEVAEEEAPAEEVVEEAPAEDVAEDADFEN